MRENAGKKERYLGAAKACAQPQATAQNACLGFYEKCDILAHTTWNFYSLK